MILINGGLEAGFVEGKMLLQGSVMGAESWGTTELSDDETKNVSEFIEIKAEDAPLAIVSMGYV